MSLISILFALIFLIETNYASEIKNSPGQPLFLTPYIEEGSLIEARNAAIVNSDIFGNVTSYSGFLTVNKTYEKNLFMWFFPCENIENPLILWLQGGPGLTSLFGLFTEIGPFELKNDKIFPRNYTWSKTHSILFIDNPVGTGFSFTKNGGIPHDEFQLGDELYEAIRQFFVLFQEFRTNDFYVAGESYAGKYIPVISHEIFRKNLNLSDPLKINLKGLSIGNGWLDPVNQMDVGEYTYQLGLVDSNTKQLMDEFKNESISLLKQGKFVESTNVQREISTLLKNVTGYENLYNYLHPEAQDTEERLKIFVEKNQVRKAIHVGNLTFNDDELVDSALIGDIMISVADLLADLLNNFKVLIYGGQLDLAVPYPTTVNYLSQLKFSGADEYKAAKRKIWHRENEIAGYVKNAGNLTEVLILNAGHMVPSDKPEIAYDMINRFTGNEDWN